MDTSHNKKLKVFAVCLLGVSVLSLALALLKTTGVIFKPKQTEAMKGSESVGGRYLKEESYWERYGVSPEGLVLWLSQSDARSYGDSANWYDISGKGNHGTQTTADYQPAITSGSGLAGFARSFDGSNDYVSITNINNFTALTQGTISAWVKPANTGSPAGAIFSLGDKDSSNNNAYLLYGSQDFYWALKDNADYVVSCDTNTNMVVVGSWNHVVLTVDASGNKMYVNGVQKALTYGFGNSATAAFLNKPVNSDYANIGFRNMNGTTYDLYFNGLIDDVRIYNRALTAAEIKKLYLADKPRYGGM